MFQVMYSLKAVEVTIRILTYGKQQYSYNFAIFVTLYRQLLLHNFWYYSSDDFSLSMLIKCVLITENSAYIMILRDE